MPASGVPAAVVVVVSSPAATTITPVPVEEVEARAARDAAKPTERCTVPGAEEGVGPELEGGGGRGIGVVGVPAAVAGRKGRPSRDELMIDRRRRIGSALSPPSREAWDRR